MRTLAAVAAALGLAAGAAASEPAPRDALIAATTLRGPLEGSWRLDSAIGRPLYAIELADPGGAPDPRAASLRNPSVEGAWRDLRRPADKTASGVFDNVAGSAHALTLRFSEGPNPRPTTVVLHTAAHGVWRGWLKAAGASTRVVMRRPAAGTLP